MRPLFAFVALAAIVDGCTLLVDSTAAQCVSDSDCTSRSGEFAGSACGPDGVCVLRCRSHASCAAKNGEPSICVQSTGACARLLSPDCETILAEPGALERDDAVVLGLLLKETGAAGINSSSARAVELARRHVHLANAGLPGVNGGASRPLVLLWCTEARDPLRAARHLAHEVRVPAIVGPSADDVVTKIATRVTIPAGVLLISPTATSSTLTDLVDGGLLWRTAPSDASIAWAMAVIVSQGLEPDVRAAHALGSNEKLRIAVVHRGDARASSVASTLTKLVRLDRGEDGASDEEHLRRFDYGDPQKLRADARAATQQKVVVDTVAFLPHVIVTIGETEAVTEILAGVEARWPAKGPARPRHLLSDGLRVPELLTLIDRDGGLRGRVLGVAADVPGRNFETFANAYAAAFPGLSPDIHAARAYDATLLLGFAIAAGGGAPLTGALVRDGLKRTVPRPGALAVNADFNEINKGFGAMLNAGIDYDGASGPLDFDLATGDAPAEVQAWCVAGTRSFARAGRVREGELTGDLECR